MRDAKLNLYTYITVAMGNCLNFNDSTKENVIIFQKNRLIKSTYKMGVSEYITTFYHSNGVPRYIITYSDVEKINTGKYKIYYPDGTLKESGAKVNSRIDGETKTYHANSNLAVIGSYKLGVKDGPFKEFYSGGNLKCSAFYIDGLLHGEYKEYNEVSVMTEYIIYNQGNIIKSWFLDRAVNVPELERKFDDNLERLIHPESEPEQKQDQPIYTVLEIPE
jgi:antitoxin component YwqK of YwqJK toxin-antitoxin module